VSAAKAYLSKALIHVAAGALADAQGRILIAKRRERVHQGGLWEFPGGKLERGETPAEGLARELFEELGVRIRSWRPLIRIHHDYGDRLVLLDVYRVDDYEGKPIGREGQPLAWVAPDAMDPVLFPAADRPIITALRLPNFYLISGADPARPDTFIRRLRKALASGIKLMQLRAHGLSDADYASLARLAYPLCRGANARLLLNRDPELANKLPCDGLHLTSTALHSLHERPSQVDRLVGASCHDAQELRLAERLGLDYAFLSPVEATATHPNAQILGWKRFEELVDAAHLPIYALGGMTPAHLDRCIQVGAQGVAAIRGLWPD
jgi:8-oxo-dGTP diphosphatase